MRAKHRKIQKSSLPEQSQGGLGGERSIQLRQSIFWLHLVVGIVTGLVMLVMSLTGVLLAFERPIVTFAERHVRTVHIPAASLPRLDLEVLVAQARAAVPAGKPSGVLLRADPTASAVVNFGREQVVFVNPYTGVVLGEGAKTLRHFLHVMTDWHRWLGREGESHDVGRAMTGACNTAFGVMVITGFYLWWPRRWTRQALKAVMVPNLTLRGKPRDWNWHNTAGFWSAAILLCITLTGFVMSYQWASDLIYTLTGSVPPPRPPNFAEGRPAVSDKRRNEPAPRVADAPPAGSARRPSRTEGRPAVERQERTGEGSDSGPTSQRASLEALFAAATEQAPHWRSMTLRLPQRGATQLTITLEEAESPHPYPRSILTLDVATAAVVQWEPYASYNLGRTIRAWVRPVHTGEAGGLIGQVVAALASAGGALLVWTGLGLAWRRFRGRNVKTSRRASDFVQP